VIGINFEGGDWSGNLTLGGLHKGEILLLTSGELYVKHVKFGYQLSTRSRAEKTHGKP
jgi:hypothetical protein